MRNRGFVLHLLLLALVCWGWGATPARAQGERIDAWLRGARVERPRSHRNLVLYPIHGPRHSLPRPLTLDAALEQQVLEVREVSESGSVNRLVVENQGRRAVFIMAGEILVGAKQDRVLQHDVWLPAESGPVEVAAFCVEKGRWNYQAGKKNFAEAAGISNTQVRAAARLDKSQAAVWKSVDETQRGGRLSAPTGALTAAYKDPATAAELDRYTRGFADFCDDNPGMNGIVVQIDRRLVAIDVFPDEALFQRMWPKLLRSYALEACSQDNAAGRAGVASDVTQAQRFLERALGLSATEVPHVGEGELISLTSPRFGGEALQLEDGLVHLELFARRSVTPQPRPIPRPRPRPEPGPDRPWPPARDLIRPNKKDNSPPT